MQIVVDGIVTTYEVLGDKKPTLLILHGWQRSLNEWRSVALHLSKTHKVILVDLPGFGQTPRPIDSYTIYDYATFVEHFIKKLDLSHITLLGHSFGGRIGIILGAKTTLLEKLILVDSAAVETKSFLTKSRITVNKLIAFPIKILLPRQAEHLKKRFGSSDYQNAGAMRDIFINIVNEDLTPLLKDVKPDTLIVWGEKDSIRPLSEAQTIENEIPHVSLRIVWGAGHSPYLEKPREFLDIIEENIC